MYYDFSGMIAQLDELNDTNSDIYTELKSMHQDQKESLQQITSSLNFLTVLVLISAVGVVLFR